MNVEELVKAHKGHETDVDLRHERFSCETCGEVWEKRQDPERKGETRMSAFVVDKSHINAILKGAMSNAMKSSGNHYWFCGKERHDTENADRIGQMLLDENIRSVSYRYPDISKLNDLPGRTDCEHLLPFQFNIMGRTPRPIELIKLVHCLDYQSCEHPEWRDSEAKAFCDSVIECAIYQLPGYEEAPWEWQGEFPATRPDRDRIRLV